jgi:hypothetical protein
MSAEGAQVKDVPTREKGLNFYAEVILTAIFSILAAGLWKDLIVRLVPENNTLLLGTICIILTVASIFLLEYLFSNKDKVKNEK